MTTITDLEAQLKAIQVQIDAMKQGEWPKVDAYYWIVSSAGLVNRRFWTDTMFDQDCLFQGNCYRTEAEAQRKADRNALIWELRCRAGHYKPVFGLEETNYYLYYETRTTWEWARASLSDICPASGYFADEMPGLTEEFGDRLNLLRDI
jgi:hypothetical protein